MTAALDIAEALSAVGAHDQAAAWFIHAVFIVWIDDQISKIKRTPDHHLAAVALLPGLAGVVGTEESAARGFDERIHHVRFRGRHRHGDTAPRLGRQTFGGLLVQLRPVRATISALKERTAARRGGAVAARPEGPPFAAEIPQA